MNDTNSFSDSVFWRALMFWKVFFKGAIYLKFMVAD